MKPGEGGGRDPELQRLLLQEFERHVGGLVDDVPLDEQRRAIHALKGSAALAGERGLAESLARLERRILAGDRAAAALARVRIAEASSAIAGGRPIPAVEWPDPPDDLAPGDRSTLDGRYAIEMHDRLDRIDRALAEGDDTRAAASAYREVHAMKGAALAALDEVTAWFCHGLEERLRGGDKTESDARRALTDVAKWRGVLAELIVAPDRALETLRMLARPRTSTSPPSAALPLPPRRPSVEPPSETEGEAALRVPTGTLDRLFERVRQVGQVRAELTDGSALAIDLAGRSRLLRMTLTEALRLIGPPRPWGAPAAAIQRIEETARTLATFSERLDREAASLKEAADRIRVESAAAHGDLAAIRTTKVSWLFDRVATAVLAEARREGREIRFAFSGEDTPLDRRIAEALYDPVLQLARNAVAHGIEPAAERALRAKPRVGTVQLRAQLRSGGLRLVVQDDGAGVQISDVRLRAVASGTISSEVARAADDATLLALLFVPGFTTRDSADLLAGRGVGLDFALDAVARLGGVIRLASQPGMGLAASIDVPVEPGVIRVLWVEAMSMTYALPAQHVRRVLLGSDEAAGGSVPLAACFRAAKREGPVSSRRPPSGGAPSAFAIDLEVPRETAKSAMIGVDAIGTVEEVALRGVSPVVATAGPYAGAILRGNELRLCLDAHALAELIVGSE